jgi:enoyl-CoA hydratase
MPWGRAKCGPCKPYFRYNGHPIGSFGNCRLLWSRFDGEAIPLPLTCDNRGMGNPNSPTVVIEITGPVTVVTIDRPERRNAVDSATAAALEEAFEAFEADESQSVAILTGAGGHFCAGADLTAISEGEARPIPLDGPGPMGPTRMNNTKPVIAAVEGYAVAGGLELALWCDLRVAAEGATFGVYCRRFGVPLVDLGTVRLPRLIGQSRAMDLILTGRGVGADEAFAIGLANRLAPTGGALERARELAQELAALPQFCLRSDRMSSLEQWGMSEEQAASNEARRGRAVIASGETLAGASKFVSGAGRGGTQA